MYKVVSNIAQIQKPYSVSPQGNSIPAEETNRITWKVSGAIQTAFSIDFINNLDGTTALSIPKTNSYNLYYDLLANSLVNGNEYKIIISIYDADNNSASSDPVVFSTSSRPTVLLDTVSTVNSSNYNFTATYSQAENVAIKSYIAILYNSNKVKVDSSDLLTSTPLQYRFNNLINGDSYYVEFQVTSAKGLTATSGLVPFNVSYDAPNISVNLTAENTDNAGIKLSMNILQIIADVSGVVSFPDNTTIDVTQGSVIFDSSISIDQEFTMKLWISSPKSKSDLFILNGTNGKMTLQYDVVDKKFHLTKSMTNSIKSTWVSNEVQYDKYFVIIQQFKNGDINISVEPSTI